MRGALHYATDDAAVRRFGRDDGFALRWLGDGGGGAEFLDHAVDEAEAGFEGLWREDFCYLKWPPTVIAGRRQRQLTDAAIRAEAQDLR